MFVGGLVTSLQRPTLVGTEVGEGYDVALWAYATAGFDTAHFD